MPLEAWLTPLRLLGAGLTAIWAPFFYVRRMCFPASPTYHQSEFLALKHESRILSSVWPKQFTAVITAVIFGRITAESVSAILSCVSVVRDKESYPLLVQFWFNSPYLKPWKYQHVQVRSQNMAETSNFRPKMAVSAENHIFGRNFCYGRI